MAAKPPSININKSKSPGSKTALDSPVEQISQKFLTTNFHGDEGTHDIIVLDMELDSQIAKVLKEKEVDKTLVNIRQKVANQVNELFPTEESITGSDAVLEKLKLQIQQLDDELRRLISANQDKNTNEIITQIKKEIQDLVKKIQVIKAKAAHCEKTVIDITRDIKSLDETKKNLSSAMSLIKRIHLTVNALEYMKGMANRKQYGNVADALRTIVRVYAPLKEFKDNQQILSLCEKMMVFENEIKKSIFNEFEGAFNGGTIAMQAETLNEACYVLESLEMDAKNQLIRWYIEMQLTDYRNLFRKNPEVAGLIDISRRYAWLKRSLKTYDENHAVLFPEHWKVADALSWQFCQDTKRDLAEVIMKSERDGSFDTKTMLGAIQTTTEFEAKLEHRFIKQVQFQIIQVYKEDEVIPTDVVDRYTRIISSVYDSFLWHYIDMEDQVMSEKFEGFRRSLGEIEEGVYGTSLELFLFYRQTFSNCAKLSTGKPFLDLCKMYQKWLNMYKDLLFSKLPKDERKVPNNDDLILICSILNTSDYCGMTTGQLEEKLIDTINKEFKGLVSFTVEIEAFTSLTGTALLGVVKGVENILESALILMTKKSWATTTTVGDQSEHITAIAQSLSAVIPVIRKQLASPKFFKSFCDKFVESFLSKFLNTISTRCKPLSEVGAEQMLLDTHSLNNILVAMTNHGAEEKTPPSASFTKILGKGISRVDQLLKVVLRPHEPAAPIIETYMLLYPDHSAVGFQKILELKGVRRIEMNAILEQYSQRQAPVITVAESATSAASPSMPKTFAANFFARTATVNK